MWNRLWTKLWVRSRNDNNETLAAILARQENKESLLGVKFEVPPTQERVRRDVDRVLRYSQSGDYEIWAKEAWSSVLESIDKLIDQNTTETQVDFHRGALAQTMKLLQVSYKARMAKDRINEEEAKKEVLTSIV